MVRVRVTQPSPGLCVDTPAVLMPAPEQPLDFSTNLARVTRKDIKARKNFGALEAQVGTKIGDICDDLLLPHREKTTS